MIVEATSGGAPAVAPIAPGWLAFAGISASKFKKDDQIDKLDQVLEKWF